jgi:hypothetical protein
VTGNQKARHADPANATTNSIRVENGSPEKLLPTADLNRRSSFRWAGRCYKACRPLQSYSVAFKEIEFLIVVSREQIVQQLLTLGSKPRRIRMELVPNDFVSPRSACQSFNATRTLHGSSDAKLQSFMARLLAGRPIFRATAMMMGLR